MLMETMKAPLAMRQASEAREPREPREKLRMHGLGKSFDGHRVLHDVNLSVAEGTILALLGPSGSGKTTLLRLLCGFERTDVGSIDMDGVQISGPGRHLAAERRKIGYVAQEGALFPHLSVGENIAFGMTDASANTFDAARAPSQQGAGVRRWFGARSASARQKRRDRIVALLELVGLPADFIDRVPQSLSGGQQQRVALARALAPSPELVVLDEPFSALDSTSRVETREALSAALRRVGATAVLVTHDQSEALSMGDRVAVLLNGRLAQVDRPDVLYRQPVSPAVATFVGDAVLIPGEVVDGLVRCELGVLPMLNAGVEGTVTVMVRPEQFHIVQGGHSAHGLRACVEQVVYFGHDASVDMRLLGSTQSVRIRVAGYSRPVVGDDVSLRVEGAVQIYPVDTTS